MLYTHLKELFVVGSNFCGKFVRANNCRLCCHSCTCKEGCAPDDSLIDSWGRKHTYLRISLTERCNLRCLYCMPAEGVCLTARNKLLTMEEILYLTALFVKMGVEKVRLTGGEPLVYPYIVELLENFKTIPGLKHKALTTNGLALKKKLLPLRSAGLNQINVSLDTLKADKFEQITRRRGWKSVMESIDAALEHGFSPLKVNCVVMRSVNYDEILDFASLTKDRPLVVRFIEYMPFSGNRWGSRNFVSFSEVLALVRRHHPDIHRLVGTPCDTAKNYQIPGHLGQIGFISSMSEHFCSSCNRLRITADGNLKVCLFDSNEVSLRDALRRNLPEADLMAVIQSALLRKKAAHPGMFSMSIASRFRPWDRIRLRFPRSTCHTSLSHLDEQGGARMVDVSCKPPSSRSATATGLVYLGSDAFHQLQAGLVKKGDVLTVAKVAGILAAKDTSRLIPLCHNIRLGSVDIDFALLQEEFSVRITSRVTCLGNTGAEMESLVAVSVAALTIYDMCKSVSLNIKLRDIELASKTGGKRDFCSAKLPQDGGAQ